MPEPIPFDPHRFQSAANHYRQGRPPYPPSLIRGVAERLRLTGAHRVLDLGCGPGQLAIGFAYFAGAVVALDPEPAMLDAARAAALGLAPSIRFQQGSSHDLGPDLGRFRLAVMGRSFHWMDRAETLRRLDAMIEPQGAVALFGDTHADVPENAWSAEWRAIMDRYATGESMRSHQRSGDWVPHEALLLASPFCRLEVHAVLTRQSTPHETLIDRALSMSNTSRARIGARADELVSELADWLKRTAPDGQITEVLEHRALIARRDPG